jgi:hypothetical protein
MLTYKRLNLEDVNWAELDKFPDRMIYQTRPWLEFIAESQHAEPVVAALYDGGDLAGYFTGAIVKKMGLKILGSPFPGWTTAYMGFNLLPGVTRRQALEGLSRFAFDQLGCVHVELMDRFITEGDYAGLGFECAPFDGYEIDLTKTEEEIVAAMAPKRRQGLRTAIKKGLVAEEASDPSFADDYYEQLRDVFAKQSLAPTYDIERVRALIRHIHPTGRMFMIRVRDPNGLCIATGICFGMNHRMYGWGAASWRQHQYLHPNELLFWHKMLHWKRRGMEVFDMAGGGDYKLRYGAYRISAPWLRKSKYPGLTAVRDLAQRIVGLKQSIAGSFTARRAPQ